MYKKRQIIVFIPFGVMRGGLNKKKPGGKIFQRKEFIIYD